MRVASIIVPHRGAPIVRTLDHEAQEPPRAAGILLTYYKAGKPLHLLVKRSAASDHPRTWAFPGGGIEPGETALEAAVREASEEVGLANAWMVNRACRPLGISEGFATFQLTLAYMLQPRLNHEHTAWVWAPYANLPAPMHPNALAILRNLYQP